MLTMLHPQPLCDPLGHTIFIPSAISMQTYYKLNDIRNVVTSPTFIIRAGDDRLFFFRLIDWKVNMLVEVQMQKQQYIVYNCMENPSVDYVSMLLKKGPLISFP